MHLVAPFFMFLVLFFIAVPLAIGLFILIYAHFTDKTIAKKWPLPKSVLRVAILLSVLLVLALLLVGYFAFQEGAEERKLKKELNKVALNASYKLIKADCGDVELRMECIYSYYTTLGVKESSANIADVLINNGYTLTSNSPSRTTADVSWQATSSNGNIVITYTELDREIKPVYQLRDGNVQLGIYSN